MYAVCIAQTDLSSRVLTMQEIISRNALLDVHSQFIQTSTSGRVHILGTLRRIWNQEQLRGLFAGNGANCLRVLPFSAFVCLAYSNLAKVSTGLCNDNRTA